MPSIPILRDDIGYRLLFCGNSKSTFRYCGDSIHTTNYNPFQKGSEPGDIMSKRYTPRSGDDFPELIDTMFSQDTQDFWNLK